MTDMATIALADEGADTAPSTTAFTYCCECGTYDAHASVCTCCGFDFRGEAGEIGE